MIEHNTLQQSIDEAERFITAAKKLLATEKAAPPVRMKITGHWSTVAEHAAVKRASLDLTRKLADLRQGR